MKFVKKKSSFGANGQTTSVAYYELSYKLSLAYNASLYLRICEFLVANKSLQIEDLELRYNLGYCLTNHRLSIMLSFWYWQKHVSRLQIGQMAPYLWDVYMLSSNNQHVLDSCNRFLASYNIRIIFQIKQSVLSCLSKIMISSRRNLSVQ